MTSYAVGKPRESRPNQDQWVRVGVKPRDETSCIDALKKEPWKELDECSEEGDSAYN